MMMKMKIHTLIHPSMGIERSIIVGHCLVPGGRWPRGLWPRSSLHHDVVVRGIIMVLSIGINSMNAWRWKPGLSRSSNAARSCCHAWRWREPREDRPASIA
jgi:hypothetical protein